MQTEESSRLMVEFFEKLSAWEAVAVRGSGLTTAQNHLIEIIGYSGAIQMKTLAAKIGVTTGTLTANVDRLEKKNLLRRIAHETDRRSYLVDLTAEGQVVFARHHALHVTLTEGILARLSAAEQELFRQIMAAASDAIPSA